MRADRNLEPLTRAKTCIRPAFQPVFKPCVSTRAAYILSRAFLALDDSLISSSIRCKILSEFSDDLISLISFEVMIVK